MTPREIWREENRAGVGAIDIRSNAKWQSGFRRAALRVTVSRSGVLRVARQLLARAPRLRLFQDRDRLGRANDAGRDYSGPWPKHVAAYGRPAPFRLSSRALLPSGCTGRWKWNRARWSVAAIFRLRRIFGCGNR